MNDTWTAVFREALAELPRGASTRLAEACGVQLYTVSRWRTIPPARRYWEDIEAFFGWPAGRVRELVLADPDQAIIDRVELLERQVARLAAIVQELIETDAR